MKNKYIIKFLESCYPLKYSEKWDKSGLQVGDLSFDTSAVVLGLDPGLEIIEYAKSVSSNLIITHHPLSIKEVFPIEFSNYESKIIKELVKNDITLYSMHTNFDFVNPSVSDYLLDYLELDVINKDFLIRGKDDNTGYGRIADLKQELRLQEILDLIKNKFLLKYLRFVGNSDRIIKRISVMGGSGASFIRNSYDLGADLYVTGDVKYHEAKLAQYLPLAVVDMGHFYSELHSIKLISKLLRENFKDININVFDGEKDPFVLWR